MGKHSRRQRALAKADDQSSGTPELRTAVPPESTAGVTGTPVFNGFVEVREKSADLVGTKKWETFSDILLNVSIVASGVRYYLNLVSQPGWRATPAEKSGQKGEQVAEHVQRCMDEMRTPWSRVIRRAALFRTHGYSIQEWTAKRLGDGSVGMLDVQSRPQSTIYQWDVTQTGEVRGVGQLSPYDGKVIYLPRSKVVYVVDDSISDSPEGSGLFRHLAEPCRQLRRYQQLEGWGFETDLRGIPVGRAPLGEMSQMVRDNQLTAAERDAAVTPLLDFIKGHVKNPSLGLLLDSLTYESQDEASTPSNAKRWDIDLLKAAASGQAEVANAIERLMRDIARVLGVEHLLMGDNGVGSFAMAKDKSHNFALMIDGALRDLQQAFAADWVARIMQLNGWDASLTPKLVTDKLQYRSVEQLTSALADMGRAGAMLAPDDPAISEVRDLMGLSHPITVTPAADASLLSQPPENGQPVADRPSP